MKKIAFVQLKHIAYLIILKWFVEHIKNSIKHCPNQREMFSEIIGNLNWETIFQSSLKE